MHDNLWRTGARVLSRSLTAAIYSNPPFAMEVVLAVVVGVVYILVHPFLAQLRSETIRMGPSGVLVAERPRASESGTTVASCPQKVTSSDYGLRSPFTVGSRVVPLLAAAPGGGGTGLEERIENILRMTPEEYLSQMSLKRELCDCPKSLSSLYEDCIKGDKSERELRRQLRSARESMEKDTMKYLGKNAQYLTQRRL